MPLATFPSPEVEFILGPRLVYGSPENPWPWFDSIAIDKGRALGKAFPVIPPVDQEHFGGYTNYYDQVMCQYGNAYCAPDAITKTEFLGYAQKAADSWWKYAGIQEGANRNFLGDVPGPTAPAPRMAGLCGLMLRALDGRPEMWDWINDYTRAILNNYLRPVFLDGSELYQGLRDPGYLLLYAATLGKVHPDSAIRDGYKADVQKWVARYWRRLQIKGTGTEKDGAWLLGDAAQGYTYANTTNPFHTGILLEGLTAVHQLTGQPEAKDAILASAAHLYEQCFDTRTASTHMPTTEATKCRWMTYFRHGGYITAPASDPQGPQPTIYDTWPGSAPDATSGYPNAVKESRQRNSTVHHVFGYAYKLSGDPKFIRYGDDVFSASFGEVVANGGDGLTNLAYLVGDGTDGKFYDQNYRASGKYLAWRLGADVPVPVPPPPPVIRKVPWPTTEAAQDKVLATQAAEGYYLKRNLKGAFAEFYKP